MKENVYVCLWHNLSLLTVELIILSKTRVKIFAELKLNSWSQHFALGSREQANFTVQLV